MSATVAPQGDCKSTKLFKYVCTHIERVSIEQILRDKGKSNEVINIRDKGNSVCSRQKITFKIINWPTR